MTTLRKQVAGMNTEAVARRATEIAKRPLLGKRKAGRPAVSIRRASVNPMIEGYRRPSRAKRLGLYLIVAGSVFVVACVVLAILYP